jgi:cell division protein FtsN
MSDHDRGAYTPQTDAPLAFDARAPRGGRKPLPMALIGSAVVLLVLVVGVAMYYRSGVRSAGSGPAVVGQPVEAMKAAPNANQVASAEISPDKLDVYGGSPAAPPTPAFAPPPETPQARPAPALTVQTVDNAPVHVVPATPAAKPAPAPAQAAAAPAAPTAVPAAAAPKPAASKPVQVATAPAAPKPAASPAPAPAAGGAALVQIGAYSSAALADKGWSDLAKAYPGPMGGKSKRVEPLERDGKTLYRTSVGGWASKAAAQAFCNQMKAAGRACLVKG